MSRAPAITNIREAAAKSFERRHEQSQARQDLDSTYRIP